MKDIGYTERSCSPNYLPQKIELWEIERLKTNPNNARKHSTEQIHELAASMSAFGFTSAVVAGSDRILLAGNARLLEARELGLPRDGDRFAWSVYSDQAAPHRPKVIVLLAKKMGPWRSQTFKLRLYNRLSRFT